jgi:two-component system, cell cycle response regulator
MAKAKVLLVEDNKTQAELVRLFLDKRGYDVIWAENGMAALKVAKTEQIDLILLDVVLPDIDGNEVCRWLKLNDDTRAVPIIMLTEKKAILDKVTGLESGANDYLPKPFDESELNARIYVQLRAKVQHDDLKKKNRQLEDMLTRVETLATMDSLTGLSNRRRFETILENEFRRSVRYQHSLSCMLIDIDLFKQVNDLFGHQVGDSLLKEIAQVIQSSIREVDTAARWGGEEFVVLSPNTPVKNARIAAARILKAISGREFTATGHQRITVSIGIAGLPDPAIDTQEKLVHAADLAMYEAKKKGRNRIEPE